MSDDPPLCTPSKSQLAIGCLAHCGQEEQVLNLSTASSRGRGTRAAGWFSDYIADRGDGEMESLVLLEGIKGWATTGGEFVEWMDEYDAAVWIGK